MGQEYSKPEPNTKLQVIGIGLPRTGTASLSLALDYLFPGPVYHGGTQFSRGPSHEVRAFTKVLQQWPTDDPAVHEENRRIIRQKFEGFAAVQDVPPLLCYLEDLPKMYPDAKFVCSVRDVDAWVESMRQVRDQAVPLLNLLLRVIVLPLPTMRYFPDYIDGLTHQWLTMFGEDTPTQKTWYEHQRLLEKYIPKDRLVYVDVRDGWEPLCRALDLPVPEEVPFPRINDSKAIDDFAKETIQAGLMRWALAAGLVTVAVVSYCRTW